GRLVEKIGSDGLPAVPITHLQKIDDRVLIKTVAGNFISRDGLIWEAAQIDPNAWATPKTIPVSARLALESIFAPRIPLERLILDLHSGRLFGRYGPLFMDLIALVLTGLGLSGVWIYWRSLRRRKRKIA
ncbi:MAG: hypothetical protein ACREUA_00035, partial [Burkholderiales bacterium]